MGRKKLLCREPVTDWVFGIGLKSLKFKALVGEIDVELALGQRLSGAFCCGSRCAGKHKAEYYSFLVTLF